MGPAIDNIDLDEEVDNEMQETANKSPIMQQINETKYKVTG